jgi:hypothetical protein
VSSVDLWSGLVGTQSIAARRARKHLVITDARSVALVAQATAANVNDITQLIPLVHALAAVRGRGGRHAAARRTTAAGTTTPSRHRERLSARGITPILARRRTSHGSGLGVCRWVVEHTMAWLHRFRRLTVRHDRRTDLHHALLTPRLRPSASGGIVKRALTNKSGRIFHQGIT